MFGSTRESRAITSLPWGDWGDDGQPTWAGTRVDNQTAFQLLTVYGSTRFICEGISTLPVDVFRDTPDGRQEMPKPPWLERPTADLDFIAWCTQVLTSLLIDGNAYLHLVYSNGSLSELVPLNPGAITVTREAGRRTYRINGRTADPLDIKHVPGIMFPGAEVGLSPIEAARQTIGKGLATEEFAGRFFGQGANLGGVIEDPGEPNVERARLMARTWARLHGGNRKAHMPGVLQGGAQWKVTGVTNEQAQFLETQQFTAAQIASFMFLIDPTEFGMPSARGSSITYQNLEQRNARKVQVTFLPWLVRLEKAISSLLPQPRYMKFNVNGLLRGDTKTRFETYEIASRINTAAAATGEPPLLTTPEMRDLEDLEPFDGEIPTPIAPAPTQPAEPPMPALSLIANNGRSH